MGLHPLEAYRISERDAARIVKLTIGTLRYESRKVFDEVLRRRLRELAGMHVRYGYRQLAVLLRREGWHVNAKRMLSKKSHSPSWCLRPS